MTIADINAEIRTLTDTDSTSLTDAVLLRRVNAAYEEVVGKLIAINQSWAFGDTNYTALPTGLQNIVNSQAEYQFNSGYLDVLRVEVKDINGYWHPLEPIHLNDIPVGQADWHSVDGIPTYYEKREDFLILYPAPDTTKVTATSGLKVFFQRTADVFTSAQVSTGTKVPGFASPFHILLAYKAALPYCLSYKKDRVPMVQAEVMRLEKELINFYSGRARDERHVMTMARRPFI